MKAFTRMVKVALACVAGFIVSALLPIGVSIQVWPLITLAFGVAAFWGTRDKASPVVAGSIEVSEGSSATITSDTIRRGRTTLWGSALAFGAALVGLLFFLYSSSEADRLKDLKNGVALKTLEMIGPDFLVDSVDFPNGVNNYETVAIVVFSAIADGTRDSLTMHLRGNCNDVCRIQMDPRDALRLAVQR